MKILSVVVLFFFVNFIALPTLAIAMDMDLITTSIAMAEEEKNPNNNLQEEEVHNKYKFSDLLKSSYSLDDNGRCALKKGFLHFNEDLPSFQLTKIPSPPPELS